LKRLSLLDPPHDAAVTPVVRVKRVIAAHLPTLRGCIAVALLACGSDSATSAKRAQTNH
jgi:hypothetical protein